jgi:hypothetical protein
MSGRNGKMRARWIALCAGVALCALGVCLALVFRPGEAPIAGPTIGEKIGALRAERAGLQARSDGEARVALLPPMRIASLLTDALAARGETERDRPFARLSADRRWPFVELEALNAALKEALARPGEGARQSANAATARAQASLERLAGVDDQPLVLQYTPRFIAPRRTTGDLTLAPREPDAPPSDKSPLIDSRERGDAEEPTMPTVPRYAPSFAAASDEDPPVPIEIVGLHLAASDGPAPVLTLGAWQGTAATAPERLRFLVPRNAFTTEVARTVFVVGSLAVRRGGHTSTFELLFTVLPDRPGSFAVDQKVRTTATESQTLVSPEILARGGAGETRVVRRCFDPPPGWRFDKEHRRVVVVERLGSQDDISDPTANSGTAEFATDETPEQICLLVTARPTSKTAKSATIARFEATLIRDKTEERVVKSGVRALDWREAIRVPFAPELAAWKLYIRLFDEIDREYDDGEAPVALPFVKVTPDVDGKALILQADPALEP